MRFMRENNELERGAKEYPQTFRPNDSNNKVNQVPLKTVWPVINPGPVALSNVSSRTKLCYIEMLGSGFFSI